MQRQDCAHLGRSSFVVRRLVCSQIGSSHTKGCSPVYGQPGESGCRAHPQFPESASNLRQSRPPHIAAPRHIRTTPPPVGAPLVGAQALPHRNPPPIRDANTALASFLCPTPCPPVDQQGVAVRRCRFPPSPLSPKSPQIPVQTKSPSRQNPRSAPQQYQCTILAGVPNPKAASATA